MAQISRTAPKPSANSPFTGYIFKPLWTSLGERVLLCKAVVRRKLYAVFAKAEKPNWISS